MQHLIYNHSMTSMPVEKKEEIPKATVAERGMTIVENITGKATNAIGSIQVNPIPALIGSIIAGLIVFVLVCIIVFSSNNNLTTKAGYFLAGVIGTAVVSMATFYGIMQISSMVQNPAFAAAIMLKQVATK